MSMATQTLAPPDTTSDTLRAVRLVGRVVVHGARNERGLETLCSIDLAVRTFSFVGPPVTCQLCLEKLGCLPVEA
jgi:hypothetical protein